MGDDIKVKRAMEHIRRKRRTLSQAMSKPRPWKPSAQDAMRLAYVRNIMQALGAAPGTKTIEQVIPYLDARDRQRLWEEMIYRGDRKGLRVEEYFLEEVVYGRQSIEESIGHMVDSALLRPLAERYILQAIPRLLDRIAARKIEDATAARIADIGRIFCLSAPEMQVLQAIFLATTDDFVERVHDELAEALGTRTASTKFAKTLPVMLNCARASVQQALSDSSRLIKAGILDSDRDLAPEICRFLSGMSKSAISEDYFAQVTAKAVPVESLTVEKKHLDVLTSLWKHRQRGTPLNILLYGKPGAGKTEFARSLGNHLGLATYEVRNLNDCQRDERALNSFRYRAFMACQQTVDLEKSLIIVDEADTLLNSAQNFFLSFAPMSEKGQINKILDESKAFTIWITNRTCGIDESTSRRFDYSIEFGKFTFEQRTSVWKSGIRKHGLTECLNSDDIVRLAEAMELSAGGIDVALRNAAGIYRDTKSREQVLRMIEDVARAHLRVLNQETVNAKKVNAPAHTLEGLNIKTDLNRVLSGIDRFNQYWSKTPDMEQGRNMNLLLYGPPGTGKTEFAKYTARRLNRRLIVRNASHLLSMWVGETEKNIRQAFEDAQRDKAILFIDEADSFFWGREGASHSWEVTQVNELLTNMERLAGMLICATNFHKLLDCAAIRRFNLKLEFDFLKPEGALRFYELFFKGLVAAPISQAETAELSGMAGLAPGDFKVVHQQHAYFPAGEITHRMLIDALKNEVAAKSGAVGKKMGFGA